MYIEDINATSERLFALLRAGLWGIGNEAPFVVRSDDEWLAIYRMAVRHGVLAVAWDGVKLLPADARPPQRLLLQWGVNVERIEQCYHRQMSVISRLAAFYGKHGLKMMVLKGYALSLFYPVPEHRAYGDIDIWLYGHQPEADKAIAAEWGISVDDGKEHHTTFAVDGVMIENHYDFVNMKTHASNMRTERLLKRYASERGSSAAVGAAEVDLPSVRLNSLFLLRHAAVHFAAINIELRHLVDWAVFVACNHEEIDWPGLHADAEAVGMAGFLDCLNGLCIERLGVDAALFGDLGRDVDTEKHVLGEILSPRFTEMPPAGVVRVVWFKIRRWWANRWKHRLVHRDSLAGAFVRSTIGHLLKPKSIGACK